MSGAVSTVHCRLTFKAGKAVGFLGFATSQMTRSPSAPPDASKFGLSWLKARPLTCSIYQYSEKFCRYEDSIVSCMLPNRLIALACARHLQLRDALLPLPEGHFQAFLSVSAVHPRLQRSHLPSLQQSALAAVTCLSLVTCIKVATGVKAEDKVFQAHWVFVMLCSAMSKRIPAEPVKRLRAVDWLPCCGKLVTVG